METFSIANARKTIKAAMSTTTDPQARRAYSIQLEILGIVENTFLQEEEWDTNSVVAQAYLTTFIDAILMSFLGKASAALKKGAMDEGLIHLMHGVALQECITSNLKKLEETLSTDPVIAAAYAVVRDQAEKNK